MAIKKTELYRSLWASCDALRGGMDASQYKDYVLTLLFVKYISDRYKGQPFAEIKIPEGASFQDMAHLVGTSKDLGDDINKKILNPIKEANQLNEFPDFNDPNKFGIGKEKEDTLAELILIFNSPDLDFSKNNASGDDILGDAYEFLMRHFAQDSGKSKGQFYTPAEVSRVLAKVIGISPENSTAQTTAYDPTCGSFSLLLKVADEAGKQISLYGQEKDIATANLARMNSILHDNATAEIFAGNTLSSPHFRNENGKLRQFDYIVANPPFSLKNWSSGVHVDNDEFHRFDDFGTPPDKNGDYAFLLHIVKSMKSTGKSAIVLPHGVLFRGNAEATIRKNLIKKGYIKAIIGLPANLFYGTGIPACILVLDKEFSAQRKGIFMIDASKGFIKDGDKNRLREQDIRKITDVYHDFLELEKYSRMVPLSEISDAKNDYNLNIPRYIDSQEVEDIQDIYAHLNGGIPKRDLDNLKKYWKVYPDLRNTIFKPISQNYAELIVPKEDIKTTIFKHPQFLEYAKILNEHFHQWKTAQLLHFEKFDKEIHPKDEIQKSGNQLLELFADSALIDNYDLYQHLMNYWSETMQDDFYTIASEGWKAGNDWERQIIKGKKGKDGKTTKDKAVEGLGGIIGKLLPPQLLIDHYLKDEQEQLNNFENQIETLKAQIAETEEEHSAEEGLFAELDGKVNLNSVKKLYKEKQQTITAKEELEVYKTYIALQEEVKKIDQILKTEKAKIEKAVIEIYPKLSEEEIKKLVMEEKWMKQLAENLQSEQERISQNLAQRLRELAERYETTLKEISQNTADYEAKVMQHLAKMDY